MRLAIPLGILVGDTVRRVCLPPPGAADAPADSTAPDSAVVTRGERGDDTSPGAWTAPGLGPSVGRKR